MDFSSTRLGAGMQLKLREQPVEPVIKQIVAEFENVHSDRVIETVINIPGTVRIDAGRISQMLSNLLGNAISYGAANKPSGCWRKRPELASTSALSTKVRQFRRKRCRAFSLRSIVATFCRTNKGLDSDCTLPRRSRAPMAG